MNDKKELFLDSKQSSKPKPHPAEMDPENKRQSNHISVSFYPVTTIKVDKCAVITPDWGAWFLQICAS